MAEEILASVQVRRDNKANWEAVNPILLDGEAAYEKDTDMFKIGDGVNNYKNLPYHNKVGPKGDIGATPQISMSVSTGAAGSEASVSVSGTAEKPLISLTIPRGDTGESGVTEETDPTVPAWAKQPNKPTYTAGEVGADAAGTAAAQVGAHNVSGEAHADMRARIDAIVIPDKLPNPQPLTINGQRYDGSASVEVSVTGSGGVVEVDNTLTQSGKAADAKVVGDKLSELNQAIGNKLDASALPTAVNDALAQAKTSGEFDGADGAKGADGYTPVRGTDYWTVADQEQIVSDVLTALPTWTGGAY